MNTVNNYNDYHNWIPPKFEITIGPVVQLNRQPRERATLMLLMTVDQKTTLRISPRDSHGNVSDLDSVPAWTTSDETVLAVTPAADGLSADVTVTGTIGTAQVNVSADVRKGDEVVTKSGMLDVQVVAGETATIDISADAVQPV